MIMKNHTRSHEAPYEADTFRIVPVINLDGKATNVPVQLVDEVLLDPHLHGKVLHIVMSKNAFCAWRGQ